MHAAFTSFSISSLLAKPVKMKRPMRGGRVSSPHLHFPGIYRHGQYAPSQSFPSRSVPPHLFMSRFSVFNARSIFHHISPPPKATHLSLCQYVRGQIRQASIHPVIFTLLAAFIIVICSKSCFDCN